MTDAVAGRKPKREKVQDWNPPEPRDVPPVLVWPVQPRGILKWLFGFPGYLWPWTCLYAAIAVATWVWFTPDFARMTHFAPGWVAEIFLRNLVSIALVVSLWHGRLYVQKAQGTQFKYNGRWLARDNPNFLFRNQVLDNMFWTFVSAVPIWTAYEVVTLWMQANHYIPVMDWRAHPFLFVAMILSIPLFREVHFYFVHRLIHVPALYRTVHKLHHANTNPGPWSGLAMHPVEHLLYYSGVFLHWIVPSHPIHVIFHLQHLSFVPAQGHSGFDKLVIGQSTMENDNFMHYLHHKYFEVNYGGDGLVPLDKWFGTHHDGSAEADERMNRRVLSRAKTRL